MDFENKECCKDDLNPLRKPATAKTRYINLRVLDKYDWDVLETEKELAKANVIYDAGLFEIPREGSIVPVWNTKRYKFLFKDRMRLSVNPKLWQQGKLNLNAGIFQVTDNIYQVRGFDLANMSFVRGDTGWIIIGCLTSKETAEAAIQVINEHFGDKPISAVVITHSHVDHYGGVMGVLNSAVDDVKVYVPEGFLDAVIKENVYSGVAMTRRAIYMYGEAIPRDARGQVDCGIGKYASLGTVTLVSKLEEIALKGGKQYVEKIIDGVTMQFQLTPETEAPTEMNIYIPGERSLCMAENCTATMHNIYTLRGAEVRDPIAWANYIQQAINLFGDTLTSVFEMHNWPRYGNSYCIDYMSKQRDLYQYMNDQTLRLINKGYTIEEVGRLVKLPNCLKKEWYNSQFYGTINHNCKAIYQKYIGWYNGNPVDLNKLLPENSAKKYVEYMGGEECVIEKAKESFKEGEYQWVVEVTKQVIYANPHNREAKLLCADALEQLGYIAESGPWRNEYLMGALELRYGSVPIPGSIITDVVLDAMPLKDVMYLFSIRINGLKAGNFDYKMNFIIPDRKGTALCEIKRGIFRYLDDSISDEADVTVTMSKETLYKLATTNEKPDKSEVIVIGDEEKWEIFLATHDSIDPDFNIMTPVSQ